MKRALTRSLAAMGLLGLVGVLLFVWASTGRLPEENHVQTRSYDAAPFANAPDTLSVATYNIGYLSGMTNNEPVVRSDSLLSANMQGAIALLHDANPDLIGVQEIDYGAARSGFVHQLDTIATRLRYAAAAQAVNWDERYIPFPYGRPAVHFGRTLSGQSLLSRFSIRDHARSVLTRPPQWFGRDAFYLNRLAQVGILDLGNRPLAVMNLHLEAFHTETREQQARAANALYDRLVAAGLPVLVLGDINSVLPAARPTLPPDLRREFADDNTVAHLLDGTNLHPVYADSTYRGTAPPATFPADAPDRKIDHIFYPPDLMTPVNRRIRCRGPSPPSDHCAVTASFRLNAPNEWPRPDSLPSLKPLLSD